MDSEFSKNRPWNKKNSPQSAIRKFLKRNNKFIVDKTIDKKKRKTIKSRETT